MGSNVEFWKYPARRRGGDNDFHCFVNEELKRKKSKRYFKELRKRQKPEAVKSIKNYHASKKHQEDFFKKHNRFFYLFSVGWLDLEDFEVIKRISGVWIKLDMVDDWNANMVGRNPITDNEVAEFKNREKKIADDNWIAYNISRFWPEEYRKVERKYKKFKKDKL